LPRWHCLFQAACYLERPNVALCGNSCKAIAGGFGCIRQFALSYLRIAEKGRKGLDYAAAERPMTLLGRGAFRLFSPRRIVNALQAGWERLA